MDPSNFNGAGNDKIEEKEPPWLPVVRKTEQGNKEACKLNSGIYGKVNHFARVSNNAAPMVLQLAGGGQISPRFSIGEVTSKVEKPGEKSRWMQSSFLVGTSNRVFIPV